MSDEKFKNKYRIPSSRAKWHDYGGGAYFITVCTKDRLHHFGEIVRTSENELTMHFSEIGKYLHEIFQNTNNHNHYAEIPLFVIMPNHWHAIIFIDGEKTPYQRRNINRKGAICRDGAYPVSDENDKNDENTVNPAQDGACPVSTTTTTATTETDSTINKKMQETDALKGWLSVTIGGIKSAVTKFANENNIDFAWQTRFDDRVIRNQDEMNRIAYYIENNVALWDKDCFNEINVKNTDKSSVTPPPST